MGYHRPAGFNETQTPNMDSLVASGVLFDQYYTHQYCSPSRSSYQTGRMPIHVNVLNDDEAVWNPADPVSGFAAVPRNMTGIASKLKQAGYSTALFGKVRTPSLGFFASAPQFLPRLRHPPPPPRVFAVGLRHGDARSHAQGPRLRQVRRMRCDVVSPPPPFCAARPPLLPRPPFRCQLPALFPSC